MRFRAKEIQDYLTNLSNKPYNVSIRLFNQPSSYTFPLIAINTPKCEDYTMYSGLVKLKRVNVAIEIYAKAFSENGKIITSNDVIDDIGDWLDEVLLKKFGFKCTVTSPLLPYGDNKEVYRQVINYSGMLSNDGYIYQQ